MRVFLYLRVSTKEQANQGTIETQKEELFRWVDYERHEIAGIFADENADSWVDVYDRLEGRRLRGAVERGEGEMVAVYRLDRWGRKPAIVTNGIEFLDQHGVKFRSITEQFETETNQGRLMLNLLASFAQFEKETIIERCIAGKNRIAREDYRYTGGVVPYGYTIIPDSDPHSRKRYLAPDEEHFPNLDMGEADVIRFIYHLYSREKLGPGPICNVLEGLGVPTACALGGRFKSRNHNPQAKNFWKADRIRQIVSNPLYKGIAEFGKTASKERERIVRQVPPLVDEETWTLARVRVEDRKHVGWNAAHYYLLRGKIRCHNCGQTYMGCKSIGTHRNYRKEGDWFYACRGRLHRRRVLGPEAPLCHAPHFYGPDLEAEIWEQAARWLGHPEKALALIHQQLLAEGDGQSVVGGESERLRLHIEKKELGRRGYQKLLAEGDISRREYDSLIAENRAEEVALRQQLATVEQQRDGFDRARAHLHRAEVWFAQSKERLRGEYTPEQQRDILEDILKGIEVWKEGGAWQAKACWWFGVPATARVPAEPTRRSSLYGWSVITSKVSLRLAA